MCGDCNILNAPPEREGSRADPVRQNLEHVFLSLYKLQVSNTQEEEKIVLLKENCFCHHAQVCNTITFVVSYLC